MPGVCLSVCLFVCLLATLRKNYWMDLHKNFSTDVSAIKEELIKFLSHPDQKSGSRVCCIRIRAEDTDSASRPDSPLRMYAVCDWCCLCCVGQRTWIRTVPMLGVRTTMVQWTQADLASLSVMVTWDRREVMSPSTYNTLSLQSYYSRFDSPLNDISFRRCCEVEIYATDQMFRVV